MLNMEIIVVCSQINTKHINAVWAERGSFIQLTWIAFKDSVRTAQ